VVRAGVAGALGSLAWLTARERDRWHFLLLGAVVLLAWNPYNLLDAGFQLSFAAVVAIFDVAPRIERRLAPQQPEALAAALRALAAEPPQVSLAHMALRFPPVSQFLERFRALLRRRRVFDFASEVEGLSRLEQASAFLALLELRKADEVRIEQTEAFGRIRVLRGEEKEKTWTIARSA
jgi:hypothetical protein